MSNTADFVIENGVLQKYKGRGDDVVVPEGVTSIGWHAFYECTSLTSVTIPESVTSIEAGAFERCSSLTSITLPAGLTSIGEWAFRDCSSLTSVTLPDSVTSIGDWAFRGCEKLADAEGFIIVKGILFDYNGPGGNVVVPDGVTSIGNRAFSDCSSLKSITLPEGVTSIGDYAFSGCSSLTSITLPESVTSIGWRAFCGCKAMADANGFVIVKGMLYNYYGPGGNVVVPDSVTRIDCDAFSDCKKTLRSITIPANVTEIDGGELSSTFGGCEKLKTVILPAGLIKLDDYAFFGCKALKTITLPDGLNEIGRSTFASSGLTSITLPASVTKVGDEAFRHCKKLVRMVVLGKPAFGKDILRDAEPLLYCTQLPLNEIKSVKMKRWAVLGWILRTTDDPPVKETVAESYRKYWEKSLDVFLDDVLHDDRVLPALLEQKLLSLEQTDQLLEAFSNRADAVASLLTYKQRIFSSKEQEKYEGKKVEKALKPPTSAELKKTWAIKVLEDDTLELVTYKGTDTVVAIPERIGNKTVSEIGPNCLGVAYWYGDNFRPIENNDIRKAITAAFIPEGIRRIHASAFEYCEALQSIELPRSVKTVGYGAFMKCTSLVDFCAAEGLKEICDKAFSGCTALRRAKLPLSLKEIASDAFAGCDTLTIYAPARSYAAQYAKENNIPFVAE